MKQEEIKTNKELPKVEIVVVTYKDFDKLIPCIESIKKLVYPEDKYAITISDNNTDDETAHYIQEKYPKIKLLQNKKNLGFAGGMNVAFRQLSTNVKYVLLLNSDSKVGEGWAIELVKTMEEHPKAAICGAKEVLYELYGKEIEKENRIKEDCVWIGFGSAIIRKEALEEVGFFDEAYFMYTEDVDFSLRVKIAGWKIMHNYNALWFHAGKARKVDYKSWRMYWCWKNRVYLLIKFGSWKQVLRSLHGYARLFVGRKRKQENLLSLGSKETEQKEKEDREMVQHMKQKIRWDKILFAAKVGMALTYTIPWAFWSRKKIHHQMKKQGIDYNKTNAWIQETDMQFYGIET